MTLLEIEQKFSFCLTKVAQFRSNKGTPPFQRLQILGSQTFEDIYYDTNCSLSNAGLWVRKREREWEAKQRVHGNFAQSAFYESSDPAEIHRMIQKHFPHSPGVKMDYGLDILCRFRTSRETASVDGKFTVVLDKTDFGHVGEVELLAEDAEKSHAEIAEFMAKYSWFFDKKGPKGKLSAYFEKYGLPAGMKI